MSTIWHTKGMGKMKLKKDTGLKEYSPTEELLDEKFIAMAIWDCLKNNDPQGVIEILETHLEVVNKVKAAREAKISRSSLYKALKGKNPTLKTVAKLVHCLA
jgi:probable addiction module antidote protein